MGKKSFEAHLRYLLATDVAGFLIGALILILVSRIRSIVSPLALVLIIIALGLAFGLDVALWLRRGIRSVELDDETLVLYRGTAMTPQPIRKDSVQRIRVVNRLGRRTAVLHLSKIRSVRITEEAFPRETFSRFLSVLEAWGTDPSRN
ncbi:MAG TPA: hypothetical protein VMV03_04530 [Spirochaetia bacterium]|nr:hypothetical protein [Spirochaetia bacterium]